MSYMGWIVEQGKALDRVGNKKSVWELLELIAVHTVQVYTVRVDIGRTPRYDLWAGMAAVLFAAERARCPDYPI